MFFTSIFSLTCFFFSENLGAHWKIMIFQSALSKIFLRSNRDLQMNLLGLKTEGLKTL